jgi:hypothetical protein
MGHQRHHPTPLDQQRGATVGSTSAQHRTAYTSASPEHCGPTVPQLLGLPAADLCSDPEAQSPTLLVQIRTLSNAQPVPEVYAETQKQLRFNLPGLLS